MGSIGKTEKAWLAEKFGNRANFQPTERMLYGHDIAAVPGLFKPVLGNTVPDAVVQPRNEEELAELVKWAADRDVSMVARGKGSSGYGGVIPIRQGLVIDFYGRKDVLAVDAAAETVTVEPGITWEQLDRKLGPVGGLALGMMKPMFPILFPKLLPGMMPKVMPTMLERVGAMIPMPDYMIEQMPELMPKVMDNLMPHMLPDVVPLAVPKMIAFLRGRKTA